MRFKSDSRPAVCITTNWIGCRLAAVGARCAASSTCWSFLSSTGSVLYARTLYLWLIKSKKSIFLLLLFNTVLSKITSPLPLWERVRVRGNRKYRQTFFNRLVMPPQSFTPTLLPPPSRGRDVLVFLYFLTEFFITSLTISIELIKGY